MLLACQFAVRAAIAEAQASNLNNVTRFACTSASWSTRSLLCRAVLLGHDDVWADTKRWHPDAGQLYKMSCRSHIRWILPMQTYKSSLWIWFWCHLVWVSHSCFWLTVQGSSCTFTILSNCLNGFILNCSVRLFYFVFWSLDATDTRSHCLLITTQLKSFTNSGVWLSCSSVTSSS